MSNYYKKCIVKGCPNNSIGDKLVGAVRFFQIPAWPDKRYPHDSTIIEQRRALWIARLNINNYYIKTKYLVCSIHFVFGKPCYYLDKHHPDWAPSLLLDQVSCSTRSQRRIFFNYNRDLHLSKTLNSTSSTKENIPDPGNINDNLPDILTTLPSTEELQQLQLQQENYRLAPGKPWNCVVETSKNMNKTNVHCLNLGMVTRHQVNLNGSSFIFYQYFHARIWAKLNWFTFESAVGSIGANNQAKRRMSPATTRNSYQGK